MLCFANIILPKVSIDPNINNKISHMIGQQQQLADQSQDQVPVWISFTRVPGSYAGHESGLLAGNFQ